MRLVLRLSQSVPYPWAQYFNQAWQRHFYASKRRASVHGDRLEIICMPDELQVDHLPELNKVIAETNAAYRTHVSEQSRLRQQADNEAAKQKDQLSKLKDRLKFD